MSGWRFTVFLTIVLSIWGAMHAYVFSRLAAVPWVTQHISRRGIVILALVMWSSYPLVRFLEASPLQRFVWPLEYLAANWIGVLFLLLALVLALDVVTLGGFLFADRASVWRGWAALIALGLSAVAIAQALRAPVVRDYEVSLPGLPRERDGLVMVAISDLHLGTLLRESWLEGIVQHVNTLKTDVVVVVGDLIDGNVDRVEPMVPLLQKLRAPLGVWAVTGNHEYYAGVEESSRLFERAGFSVLRDRSAAIAPGLVLAGVDDLTARRQMGSPDQSITKALSNRSEGAAILLSHSPMQLESAATAGAGLVLCGHTHNGQIWPFNYLVGLNYEYVGGRNALSGMPVIVCRGTGTWGPRMRLWRPSEIVRITLHSAPAAQQIAENRGM